jgi:uncharacterized protein
LTASCGRRPPTVSDGADRLAVIFARRLRAEGMTVPTGSVAVFIEALNALDPLDGHNVYWAARVVLVKRPEDIDAFDRAFASFWLGGTGNSPPAAAAVEERAGVDCPERTADTHTAERPSAATAIRYSPVEVLRRKDFGDYTTADFAEAQGPMCLRYPWRSFRDDRSTRWQPCGVTLRHRMVAALWRERLSSGLLQSRPMRRVVHKSEVLTPAHKPS